MQTKPIQQNSKTLTINVIIFKIIYLSGTKTNYSTSPITEVMVSYIQFGLFQLPLQP